MRPCTLLIAAALSLAAAAAVAQDDMPAIGTPGGIPPGRSEAPATGTVLIVDREDTPFGLYFFPWRESRPETGMDRPARLLQEQLLPVDEKTFVRQIEYHNALSKALKQKGVVTPVTR